jgi:hypothetical protein
MTLLDASPAFPNDDFGTSLPLALVYTGNTAGTLVVTAKTTLYTIQTTPTVETKYNPHMVARLLRAKNGPFNVAPAGDAEAVLKWLNRA